MPNSLSLALELEPPVLVEAEGNRDVDSLKLLDGGTVRVCYYDMRLTDRITLHWPIEGSPYLPLEAKDGVDGGCVDFHIPPNYIALRIDDYALFPYTVSRDGEEQTSPRGEVRINLPSNLPQVQILEAVDNKLDLSLLCCKDPVLYIPSWVFAYPVQTINCYISGIYPDGSKARLYPFQHEPVTEEDVRAGWRRALPREVLQQLKHDSELYISCEVRFNPAAGAAYRLFRALLLTLLKEPHLELPPPELKEAVHTEFDGWAVNPINTVNGAHLVVTYEGMCCGDTVCPTFSGTPGPGSPQLECRQPVEGETSLVCAVPPSAISANFERVITLAYNVTRCDGSRWSSPERRVNVLAPQLTTPDIEEATVGGVDLTTFNGDATGVVPLFDYAKEGQCCWMWLTGVDEDGAALRFDVLQGVPLKPHWLIDGVDTPIARNDLKKLADCRDFKLHFAASFVGKCDRKTAIEFPVQSFAIKQEPLVLNPPKVTEAVGSELTAWNGRDGVHVEVSYLGNHPNHTLSLCWTRPDGSCWPLESQPGSAGETTTFLVHREAVIESFDKTVKINYTVTNACKVWTSKDLNLHISAPVRLTTPEVAQATPPATQGGILDLRTFTADADTLVPNWWFMLAGQPCWLECSGPLWNGSIHTIKVMDAELITAADVTNGLSRVLKRQELDKYETGTELTFTFKVKTYAGDDDKAAIVFPVLKLLFRKRLYDETPFNPEGRDWNGWQRGAGATDPRDLRRDYGPYNWGTGYWLTNWGWTGTTNPATQSEILFRVFNNLEPGRLYKFHAWVRDDNNVPNPSLLVLRADGVDITPVFTPDTSWYLLEGSFTPSTATVRLSFNNLRMGAAPGNDFRVTWLRVYEV